VDKLTPNPKVKGKFLCPNCGANDFTYSKDGDGFTCWSGCKDSDAVNIAFKQLAGVWVEKSDNYSFTSVSNKPAVTVDNTTVKVHKKVKDARPKGSKYLYFNHDVINSPFQVCLKVLYKYQVKVKGSITQTAVLPDIELETTLQDAKINTKDVLPYYELGYNYLINDVKPERILIVEGQKTAQDCFNKFDGLLPTISVYGGSGFDLTATVEHLKLITSAKVFVLSPDFELGSFKKFLALSKELKQAGYSVEWLFPYPDSYWDRLNDLPDGHESVDMTDYLFESNLTAEQIINQIRVISDDELERMLTGKTVTVSGINLDSWTENVKEIILQSQSNDNYLVEGLFNQGQSVLIGAKQGVGKSTMMTQLSISITTGLDFMGRKVKQGKVIYNTSDEDTTVTIDRLVKQEVLENEDDFYNNFVLLNKNKDTGKKWSVNDLEVLKEFFKVHQPVAFVLDSLTTGIVNPTGIDINKPEIANAIESVINLCREYNVTFFLLHHLRKDDSSNDDCYSGSHQIPARFDTTWKLERVPGNNNARMFRSTKDRYRKETDYRLEFNNSRSFNIVESLEDESIDTVTSENNENVTDKEKLILDCLAKGQKSVKEISKETKLVERTVYRQLTKLIEQNVIVKVIDINQVTNRKVTKYNVNDNYKSESSHSKTCGVDIVIDNSSYIENDNDNYKSVNAKDNLNQSEVTINVQNEVIENSLLSEIKDTLDTEKESKQDTINVDGKVFKTGDYYWTNKAKITLVKIARFIKDREGVMGIGPRCEIDKATGEIIPIVDSEYDVCLDGDVYPYIE
jgi:RecA-family ATPase